VPGFVRCRKIDYFNDFQYLIQRTPNPWVLCDPARAMCSNANRIITRIPEKINMSRPISVLVTGTSGFLGGALGRHLRAAGYLVTGMSRREPRENAADRYIQHDLSTPLPLDTPRHDFIIHAAALASPWAKPEHYNAHIVEATHNVLDYAEHSGADRFVLISTTAVFYSLGDQFDITEETPFPESPVNGYAKAKREAENLVSSRLPNALIIRPRAIYGPGDTVLFPRILKAAACGMLPQILRPDGTSAKADMVYIGNLVYAIEKAMFLGISGSLNVTDACTLDTLALLTDVLTRLGYRPPRIRLTLDHAMRLATIAEWASSHLFGWHEPPITRFGVSSVAHTKTFNVKKMLDLLGPPPFTPEQGISAFVDWHRSGAMP